VSRMRSVRQRRFVVGVLVDVLAKVAGLRGEQRLIDAVRTGSARAHRARFTSCAATNLITWFSRALPWRWCTATAAGSSGATPW